MQGFVQGADRQQTTLFAECLDDWVGESNPVRAVDVFVEPPKFVGVHKAYSPHQRNPRRFGRLRLRPRVICENMVAGLKPVFFPICQHSSIEGTSEGKSLDWCCTWSLRVGWS
jgi:hypothetical protein